VSISTWNDFSVSRNNKVVQPGFAFRGDRGCVCSDGMYWNAAQKKRFVSVMLSVSGGFADSLFQLSHYVCPVSSRPTIGTDRKATCCDVNDRVFGDSCFKQTIFFPRYGGGPEKFHPKFSESLCPKMTKAFKCSSRPRSYEEGCACPSSQQADKSLRCSEMPSRCAAFEKEMQCQSMRDFHPPISSYPIVSSRAVANICIFLNVCGKGAPGLTRYNPDTSKYRYDFGSPKVALGEEWGGDKKDSSGKIITRRRRASVSGASQLAGEKVGSTAKAAVVPFLLAMVPKFLAKAVKPAVACLTGGAVAIKSHKRVCVKAFTEVLNSILMRVKINPCRLNCLCKIHLESALLNPEYRTYFNPKFRIFRTIAHLPQIRPDQRSEQNDFNFDCYNAMRSVDKNYMSEKAQEQLALHCPARDMNTYRGSGINKDECIRRCSGFKYAGRQGDGLNGGAHQCFCSNSYGKYGLDASMLLQSMYNSVANSSEPDPLAHRRANRQPEDGPGSVEMRGCKHCESCDSGCQNFTVAAVDRTKLTETVTETGYQSLQLPLVESSTDDLSTPIRVGINSVYSVSQGIFVGSAPDPELARGIVEYRKQSDGKTTPSCRMVFDVYIGVCDSCCCDRGMARVTINTAMVISKLNRCKKWFSYWDTMIRAVLNFMKTMEMTTTFETRGCYK